MMSTESTPSTKAWLSAEIPKATRGAAQEACQEHMSTIRLHLALHAKQVLGLFSEVVEAVHAENERTADARMDRLQEELLQTQTVGAHGFSCIGDSLNGERPQPRMPFNWPPCSEAHPLMVRSQCSVVPSLPGSPDLRAPSCFEVGPVFTRHPQCIEENDTVNQQGAPASSKPSRLSGHFGESVIGEDIGRPSAFAEVANYFHRGGAVFPDREKMKEDVMTALISPKFSPSEYYHETGMCQWIARSAWFETVMLGVVGFNAVWISVDMDLNKEPVLWRAHPVFIILENGFCLTFCLECVICFFAYKCKRQCLKDVPLLFNAFLALLYLFDTWVLSFVLLANMNAAAETSLNDTSGASVVRMSRLLRFARAGRMVRVLQSVPELMIMISGFVAATRSVLVTFCLLCCIVYVCAIGFKTATLGTEIGDKHFRSVPQAMLSLFLRGTLPDQSDFVYLLSDDNWVLGVLMLIFILVTALTGLNMLVGILVEVISVVAVVEKEQLVAVLVKDTLLSLLDTGSGSKQHISQEEFECLLVNPRAAKMVKEVGVDVVGLVELSDTIFQGKKELAVDEFFRILLQLRGSNTATVKDIVDMRKFILQELSTLEAGIFDRLEVLTGRDSERNKTADTKEVCNRPLDPERRRVSVQYAARVSDAVSASGHREQTVFSNTSVSKRITGSAFHKHWNQGVPPGVMF